MEIQLEDIDKRILRIVVERGMVDGALLVQEAGVKRANELMDPISKLQRHKLLNVKGDISKEDRLPFATISIRPSDKEYLHSLINSA